MGARTGGITGVGLGGGGAQWGGHTSVDSGPHSGDRAAGSDFAEAIVELALPPGWSENERHALRGVVRSTDDSEWASAVTVTDGRL